MIRFTPMSPEFRVYVPDDSEAYLVSFLKHIKGSRIDKVKDKPKKERKVRDPKANDELARKVNGVIHQLPKDTEISQLYGKWHVRDRRFPPPALWQALGETLSNGEKTIISGAFYELWHIDQRLTLGDLETFGEERLIQANGTISDGKLDFIRKAFLQRPQEN